MSRSTPATGVLKAAGIAFDVQTYAYDPAAPHIGLQAASALGESPGRVLKTIMATVDGSPVCAIVPSDCEVSMKRLAAAFAGKAARMMTPADAERVSGYRVGGISPFGQKRRVPVAMEEGACRHELVYINGGQRGLQLKLSPFDAARCLGARVVALIA